MGKKKRKELCYMEKGEKIFYIERVGGSIITSGYAYYDSYINYVTQIVKDGYSLRCVDFSNFNLRWVNLSGAWISGGNFKNTDLRNANLENAIFTGVDLPSADLSGANLKGTDFAGAIFKETKFNGISVNSIEQLQEAIQFSKDKKNKNCNFGWRK